MIPIEESRVLEKEFNAVKASHAESVRASLKEMPEAFELAEFKVSWRREKRSLRE